MHPCSVCSTPFGALQTQCPAAPRTHAVQSRPGESRRHLGGRLPAVLVLVLLLYSYSGVFALAAASKRTVRVNAGDYDRRGSVVTLVLPDHAKSARALRGGGETLPLQVDPNGGAAFILSELKKGASVSYELVADQPSAAAPPPHVRATREGSKLRFTFSHLSLMEYQAEPSELPRANIEPVFQRGAYLHPIRTVSGRPVTDDYPANHLHHHGVWWAWTKTEFEGRQPDFWNMGQKKGRVEWVTLKSRWEGPVHAGFHAAHRFLDTTVAPAVVALHETWKVTVFRPAGPAARAWMFDLESEQSCATAHPLNLPTYLYGGLGFRGNWAWNGADQTFFLTSEGETDRQKAHATRARWCDVAGDVDGQRVGIAILGHPDNFRAPQPMRVHPTEPFFCFAPQQAGDMAVRPGEVYRSRYRFVVHDGPADRAELDRLWQDYASPPVARVHDDSD